METCDPDLLIFALLMNRNPSSFAFSNSVMVLVDWNAVLHASLALSHVFSELTTQAWTILEMHRSDIRIGYRYRYRRKIDIRYRDNGLIFLNLIFLFLNFFRPCAVQHWHSFKGLLPLLVVKKLVKLGLPLIFL